MTTTPALTRRSYSYLRPAKRSDSACSWPGDARPGLRSGLRSAPAHLLHEHRLVQLQRATRRRAGFGCRHRDCKGGDGSGTEKEAPHSWLCGTSVPKRTVSVVRTVYPKGKGKVKAGEEKEVALGTNGCRSRRLGHCACLPSPRGGAPGSSQARKRRTCAAAGSRGRVLALCVGVASLGACLSTAR